MQSTLYTTISLNDFEKVSLLGSGTFGVVWHVICPFGRHYAMKIQTPNQSFERSYNEFAIQLQFSDHPNIVRLYGFSVTMFPHQAVGIQEIVRGGNLYDYVSRGRFSMPVSRFLILQMLTAVKHIHSLDRVHRDLKVENTLIDGPLELDFSAHWVKITDFGLAAPTRTLDGQEIWFTDAVGSEPYWAPEIYSGLPYRGQPADLFALGVLLFILVIGQLPFGMANDKKDELFFKLQQTDTSEYWKAHSIKHNYAQKLSTPGFRNLIEALLTKEPIKRLQIEGFIRHPWMGKEVASDVQVKAALEFYRG